MDSDLSDNPLSLTEDTNRRRFQCILSVLSFILQDGGLGRICELMSRMAEKEAGKDQKESQSSPSTKASTKELKTQEEKELKALISVYIEGIPGWKDSSTNPLSTCMKHFKQLWELDTWVFGFPEILSTLTRFIGSFFCFPGAPSQPSRSLL